MNYFLLSFVLSLGLFYSAQATRPHRGRGINRELSAKQTEKNKRYREHGTNCFTMAANTIERNKSKLLMVLMRLANNVNGTSPLEEQEITNLDSFTKNMKMQINLNLDFLDQAFKSSLKIMPTSLKKSTFSADFVAIQHQRNKIMLINCVCDQLRKKYLPTTTK